MIPLLQMRQDYQRRLGLTPQVAQDRVTAARKRVQDELLAGGTAIPGSVPVNVAPTPVWGGTDPYQMQPFTASGLPTGGGLVGTPTAAANAAPAGPAPSGQPIQSGPGNATQRWMGEGEDTDTTKRYYERKLGRMKPAQAERELARIGNRIGGAEKVPGYGNPSPRNSPYRNVTFNNSASGWSPY